MSYEIKEKLNDVFGKFVTMVSFNGGKSQRYEVDSLDPAEIEAILSKVADDAASDVASKKEQEAAVDAIKVVDGKIIV